MLISFLIVSMSLIRRISRVVLMQRLIILIMLPKVGWIILHGVVLHWVVLNWIILHRSCMHLINGIVHWVEHWIAILALIIWHVPVLIILIVVVRSILMSLILVSVLVKVLTAHMRVKTTAVMLWIISHWVVVSSYWVHTPLMHRIISTSIVEFWLAMLIWRTTVVDFIWSLLSVRLWRKCPFWFVRH